MFMDILQSKDRKKCAVLELVFVQLHYFDDTVLLTDRNYF